MQTAFVHQGVLLVNNIVKLKARDLNLNSKNLVFYE